MSREFAEGFYIKKGNIYIMATGFLKFDHDHTVYIDLDLATDEVRKAVIIDADDVETPICGGGTSDFSTAQLTVTNTSSSTIEITCASTYSSADIETSNALHLVSGNGTTVIPIILYKGKAEISVAGSITESSGNLIEDETFGVIATGDAAMTVNSGLS